MYLFRHMEIEIKSAYISYQPYLPQHDFAMAGSWPQNLTAFVHFELEQVLHIQACQASEATSAAFGAISKLCCWRPIPLWTIFPIHCHDSGLQHYYTVHTDVHVQAEFLRPSPDWFLVCSCQLIPQKPFPNQSLQKDSGRAKFIQPINSICLQSTANQWTGARTFDQESVQLISSLISYIIIQAYSLCKLSTKHWLYNSDQIVPTTSTINRFRTSSIQAWWPGCLNDIEVCFNTESSVSQASGCQVDHQHVALRTACWNIIYPIGKWLDDAWLHDIHDMCAMLLKMYHVAIIAVGLCPFSAGKVTVIDNGMALRKYHSVQSEASPPVLTLVRCPLQRSNAIERPINSCGVACLSTCRISIVLRNLKRALIRK